MDKMLNSIMIVKTTMADFNSISPEVRSLSLDLKQGNLLLGTYGSEIYEVVLNFEGKTIDRVTTLMQGHYAPNKKVMFKMKYRRVTKCLDCVYYLMIFLLLLLLMMLLFASGTYLLASK
jgi:hypothetical protein